MFGDLFDDGQFSAGVGGALRERDRRAGDGNTDQHDRRLHSNADDRTLSRAVIPVQ
jgi:hypothetical protein